jgi:hypothetical protein
MKHATAMGIYRVTCTFKGLALLHSASEVPPVLVSLISRVLAAIFARETLLTFENRSLLSLHLLLIFLGAFSMYGSQEMWSDYIDNAIWTTAGCPPVTR